MNHLTNNAVHEAVDWAVGQTVTNAVWKAALSWAVQQAVRAVAWPVRASVSEAANGVLGDILLDHQHPALQDFIQKTGAGL